MLEAGGEITPPPLHVKPKTVLNWKRVRRKSSFDTVLSTLGLLGLSSTSSSSSSDASDVPDSRPNSPVATPQPHPAASRGLQFGVRPDSAQRLRRAIEEGAATVLCASARGLLVRASPTPRLASAVVGFT